ncbi:hypothetical protein BO71DRAFT_198211 [Aspergillus ellipticus CBS 707.79]|uniref:Uncharacterized protein n=1 Tax=Aspergillus ellipticus CBS 707.79 TaxID=1448320 RepID=A0A319DEK9_9EURO|nr:hypothetical protein BO71DRAFT_198211 [Aspergillus ellipticus CBS 707.79]
MGTLGVCLFLPPPFCCCPPPSTANNSMHALAPPIPHARLDAHPPPPPLPLLLTPDPPSTQPAKPRISSACRREPPDPRPLSRHTASPVTAPPSAPSQLPACDSKVPRLISHPPVGCARPLTGQAAHRTV